MELRSLSPVFDGLGVEHAAKVGPGGPGSLVAYRPPRGARRRSLCGSKWKFLSVTPPRWEMPGLPQGTCSLQRHTRHLLERDAAAFWGEAGSLRPAAAGVRGRRFSRGGSHATLLVGPLTLFGDVPGGAVGSTIVPCVGRSNEPEPPPDRLVGRGDVFGAIEQGDEADEGRLEAWRGMVSGGFRGL